jgi:hypothetical protein
MAVTAEREGRMAEWSDGRLDEFAQRVDERFDRSDGKTEERFDRAEQRANDRSVVVDRRFDDPIDVLTASIRSSPGSTIGSMIW